MTNEAYEDMIVFLRGSENRKELSRRTMLYLVDQTIERSSISKAVSAVLKEKGWK